MALKVWRQGDVLLVPVSEVPEEAKIKKTRLLRKGEHGGLHQLEAGTDSTIVEHNGVKYILSPSGVGVVHGEHNRVDLPAGNYRVVVQREMEGRSFRYVAD